MKLLAPIAFAALLVAHAPAHADIPPPDATNGADTVPATDATTTTTTTTDTGAATDTTVVADTSDSTAKGDGGCSGGGAPLGLALGTLGALVGLIARRS